MIALPDGENRMIVASFVSTKHRNVTEGQTDRQTAGHDTTVAYTALTQLAAMPMRCKNHKTAFIKQRSSFKQYR